MRALSILILIASVVPASAVATPTAEGCHADLVCAYESDAGSSCDEFDGGSTTIMAPGAMVVGYWDCYPGGGSQSIAVYGPVNVYWGEFHYDDPKFGSFRGCFIFVGDLYRNLPCEVAAPPNPGWGNVLP